jgi:hypothetical protein
MTDTQPTQDLPSIEAALPIMSQRARDQIHLTFLIDDFNRAIMVHNLFAEAAVKFVADEARNHMPPDAARKMVFEMIAIREMARNVSKRGNILVAQVEKVVAQVPSWDTL